MRLGDRRFLGDGFCLWGLFRARWRFAHGGGRGLGAGDRSSRLAVGAFRWGCARRGRVGVRHVFLPGGFRGGSLGRWLGGDRRLDFLGSGLALSGPFYGALALGPIAARSRLYEAVDFVEFAIHQRAKFIGFVGRSDVNAGAKTDRACDRDSGQSR